ncbi:hypothetical protein PIIN_00641 [Serendipita indica DSM 11827]|uniref:Uncharacterized protein n=1 Tax=Serendipita indica (strain DSM 11827) TaxID=1109443 RepID=G4U330_SERID|nr:hypothetical protein PIIN_00641 [Serendipita indica DSM 11827]
MEEPSASPQQPRPREGRQCRICLAGPEEEATLGRMIRPWALVTTTLVLFFTLVFASSFVVSFFLPELADPSIVVPQPEPDVIGWYSPINIASELIQDTVRAFADVSTPQSVLEAHKRDMLRNVEDPSIWGMFKRRVPVSFFQKDKRARAPRVRRRDPRTPYSPSEEGPQITIWARLLRKFMLGLSLVGIISFLNLLFTLSLFGPLQIVRARWTRGGRREPANIRDIGTILIVIFVLIGVARALYGVYFGTKKLAKFVLLKAENAILEVQDDSDDDEEVEEPTTKREPETATDETGEQINVETHAVAQGSSEQGRATRRPNAIKINDARARHAEDDFGDELPTTPGGWNEEWL